jgi:signal transduction histidine kinase
MNILTNAAQAIAGEGTIRIRVWTADEGAGPVMKVAVADNGAGMSPEVLARMTDPFFTTKQVGDGTGLGLWITDNIVRAHGGTLTCDSKLGVGSTFTVTIPLDRPEPPEA